jgi:hypothetical protein
MEPTYEQLVKRVEQLERASRGGTLHCVAGYETVIEERAPSRVKEWLDKSRLSRWGDLPLVKGSAVSWRDVLTPRRVLASDGTAVTAAAETIMCPDFTFAADYMEVGDAFKYTLLFEQSTVITTPGTYTYRLRWGGAAGTSLAASGAFAPDPTAASTSLALMVEYWLVVRSVGSAGSMLAMGRLTPNDFDDASATALKGNLDMMAFPNTPAAVGSLDTTTAKALSPTVTPSVATGSITTHIAILESLN